MKKVINVKPLDDYKILLTFDNNEKRIKDMKPYLNNGVFKKLKSKSLFNSVHISFDTISWADEIDLCADTLYETIIPLE